MGFGLPKETASILVHLYTRPEEIVEIPGTSWEQRVLDVLTLQPGVRKPAKLRCPHCHGQFFATTIRDEARRHLLDLRTWDIELLCWDCNERFVCAPVEDIGILLRQPERLQALTPTKNPGMHKPSLPPKLRFEILRRDGYRCQYCGATAKETRLEVDHIIPRSQGGTDDPENLITACWECNRGKSDAQILDG